MSDMKAPRNPKDSMKSTWREGDRTTWSASHWVIEWLGIHSQELEKPVPVFSKEDKVPYTPEWQMHRWILFHALLPMAVQQVYVSLTGHNLTWIQAAAFYTVAFNVAAIHELHKLRGLGHSVGFLDGDEHGRDGVPDVAVPKVLHSLFSTSIFRPIFTVLLSYRSDQTPRDTNWLWLLLEIGIYSITLDFWFYWYHRAMHEVEFLWKFHRTHHLTKHPNPLLTIYADSEQEFFDIAGVPLMTYFTMKLIGFPLGFYEWWICHQYVMFTELAGHSGLRLYTEPPSTLAWLLRIFGAGLTIEDHDLHHRRGWRKSANYGKQTRLWDLIFGTSRDRVECDTNNVDWTKTADLNLF